MEEPAGPTSAEAAAGRTAAAAGSSAAAASSRADSAAVAAAGSSAGSGPFGEVPHRYLVVASSSKTNKNEWSRKIDWR